MDKGYIDKIISDATKPVKLIDKLIIKYADEQRVINTLELVREKWQMDLHVDILKARLEVIQEKYFGDYDRYPNEVGKALAGYFKEIDPELGLMVEDALG